MLVQIRDIWNPEICMFGLKSIGGNEPLAIDFYRHQIKLEVTQIARESHSRSSVAASSGESFKTFSNTTWTEHSCLSWTWPVHPVLLRAILRYTLGVQWSRDCFQQTVFMQPTCFGGKGIVFSHVVPVRFSTWKLPVTSGVAVGERVTRTEGIIRWPWLNLAEDCFSGSYDQFSAILLENKELKMEILSLSAKGTVKLVY